MSNPNDMPLSRPHRDAKETNHGKKILTKPESNNFATKTPFLGVGRASMGRPW